MTNKTGPRAGAGCSCTGYTCGGGSRRTQQERAEWPCDPAGLHALIVSRGWGPGAPVARQIRLGAQLSPRSWHVRRV